MAVKVCGQRLPARPPKDGNHVCYLLLHLMCPRIREGRINRHLAQARKAAKALSIVIWPVAMDCRHSKTPPVLRYFFRFPRYHKDDATATRIAEAVLYTSSVVMAPYRDPTEEAVVLRVPIELVRNCDCVDADTLVALEVSRYPHAHVTSLRPEAITAVTGFVDDLYEDLWRFVPHVYAHKHLFDAVRFLSLSRSNFFVYPGYIRDVLRQNTLTATTAADQTSLETALHSAFKAVEAIIGDPPSDDRRLAAKLKDIGLDFDELVGHGTKTKLGAVIRSFGADRDRKAAHGSTPPASIAIADLLEYQPCAHHIVIAALDTAVARQV